MRVRLPVIVLALSLIGRPALAQPSAPTGLQVYSGTFNGSDTFSAPLNTTNWVVIDREGDLSNTELQCYKPANESVVNGLLNLTVQRQTVTCNTHTYQNTSSMVQWKSSNFTYGTIEVRAKMTGGTTWPAIWLLGANCQLTNPVSADDSGPCVWPQPGSDEIDIAEFITSDRFALNQQIHSGANNAGCSVTVSSDASQNYHVYRFEWAKGSAIWKIDGVQTCKKTAAIPSTPMFLILNVAMHGTVNGSTLPQTMSVDYVTVTQP